MKSLLVSAALALAIPTQPADADQAAAIEKLQKQVQELQNELQRLKEGPPKDPQAEELLNKSFFRTKGLTLGFYGEAKYRFPEAGNNVFDPHRFVLTPSFQISDRLVFNSEIELEHGAVDESSNDGRNRFNGELELEQFYVDVVINDHFNIRSLGIDLVPVGRINKYHEPTVFYSTERPELYRELIPSTWFEPSLGVFGKITDSLNYQLMVSTGLEDAIVTSGSGATATRPAGYAAPGIDAGSGVRNGRPRLRAADENTLAYSGRLHYNGLPGLDASTSFYVTEVEGIRGKSFVGLWDIEGLYRVPKTGLELRGEFLYWHFANPEVFVANNNTSAADDFGKAMYGWNIEGAYHFWPEAWRSGWGSDMDLVPFVRYTEIVTQTEMLPGSTALDNGTTNKDFLTAGLAYFLNRNFVVKADWRRNLNGST
ncbi:MAG: hypothetical protein AB1813_28775, partial [Verrucomicrobiota bacterium]